MFQKARPWVPDRFDGKATDMSLKTSRTLYLNRITVVINRKRSFCKSSFRH